ncbi:MAG: porin [Sinimarinibacterium sp.]
MCVLVAATPLASLAAPTDDETIPPYREWDWRVTGLIQGDGMLATDQIPERVRDASLRRARIGGRVDWGDAWRFRAGVDFSDGPELRELSLEYGTDWGSVEFGRVIEPFALLQAGASSLPLMERPQPLGLAPGYGLGVAINSGGEAWGLGLGYFRATKNDETFGGREEDALTGRVTFAAYRSEDSIVHVGASASLREVSSSDDILRFVAIPETVLLRGYDTDSPLLVSDGAPGYRLYGVEFAALHGPLMLKAEVLRADVDAVVNLDTFFDEGEFEFVSPSYSGYYVEASWTITGELRDYSVRHGMFSGIRPQSALRRGGWGAFEVAARYSATDLSDPKLGGERGSVASAALNWWPDPFMLVALEGLHITEEAAEREESAELLQLRVQLNFSYPY